MSFISSSNLDANITFPTFCAVLNLSCKSTNLFANIARLASRFFLFSSCFLFNFLVLMKTIELSFSIASASTILPNFNE